VHFEDFQAAFDVRVVHDNLAVKTARTQQRRVENVRAVGGSDDDHIGARLEAVHLDQNLVEGLLTLVVAAAQPSAAMAAYGVNFVHEDDGRGFRLGALKQVADAACAHADEHFHEFRA